MVSEQSARDQLKKIGFNHTGWGRTEAHELHKILFPDEEIYELANGFYEGGFAMLVATDIRVLLIDKKPLNYLTVEDLRFDMINEMDYSHRLIGANISIATGNKTLKFTSWNQPRLRKLIGHVQHCMAQAKRLQNNHAEDQKSHLEQINQQLQAYLVAQHQNQVRLEEIQRAQASGDKPPPPLEPVKPSPELADFLYAQSLLAQYKAHTGKSDLSLEPTDSVLPNPEPVPLTHNGPQLDDLYQEGFKEIFGKNDFRQAPMVDRTQTPQQHSVSHIPHLHLAKAFEVNPLKVAYSKLPMALRNRKFGRPSFHAHSDNDPKPANDSEKVKSVEAPATY